MIRFLSTAFAVLALSGAAMADDTVESLRQPVIDQCKTMIGSEAPPSGADAACTCMVDKIIADFGDDAVKMLKILKADLNPSDVAKIAELLGISEAEAKTFVDAAEKKIEPIQQACVK